MASQLTDAFARKFFYLRLSITDVCNFRCTYCLPDGYKLPAAYNEAYHLTGDGVAVPVVRYIARHVIEPIVDRTRAASEQALPKCPLSADVSGNVTVAESVTAQVARLANE